MLSAEAIQKNSTTFFEALNRGDIPTFLTTLAEDVRTYEPVGTPANEGHQGVLRWLEGMAGFESWVTKVVNVYVSGNSAAIVWRSQGRTVNGVKINLEGVDVHEYNEDGKIATVEGYFDPSPIMAASGA